MMFPKFIQDQSGMIPASPGHEKTSIGIRWKLPERWKISKYFPLNIFFKQIFFMSVTSVFRKKKIRNDSGWFQEATKSSRTSKTMDLDGWEPARLGNQTIIFLQTNDSWSRYCSRVITAHAEKSANLWHCRKVLFQFCFVIFSKSTRWISMILKIAKENQQSFQNLPSNLDLDWFCLGAQIY